MGNTFSRNEYQPNFFKVFPGSSNDFRTSQANKLIENHIFLIDVARSKNRINQINSVNVGDILYLIIRKNNKYSEIYKATVTKSFQRNDFQRTENHNSKYVECGYDFTDAPTNWLDDLDEYFCEVNKWKQVNQSIVNNLEIYMKNRENIVGGFCAKTISQLNGNPEQ